MSKRRPITLLLLTCVVLAVLSAGGLLMLSWHGEPAYNGRKLSEWLPGYNAATPKAERLKAEDAIRQIGTNGLPWLLKWIRYEEGSVKREARIAFRKLHLGPTTNQWRLTDAQNRRAEQAAWAIATLGPQAEDAVEELTRLLNSPGKRETSRRAAFALTHLGEKALPPLITTLTNQPAPARSVAAYWFYCLGTNAHPALPILIQCLSDPDPGVARGAAVSLGNLKLEPSIVVPALARSLASGSNGVQPDAAIALAQFGTDARSAVPALLAACSDSWFKVRNSATNALLKIAPEALTNAPPH